MYDVLLRKVDERAYNGDVRAAHVAFWREGVQATFIKQAHEESFHGIVPMVAQGYLIAAMGFGKVAKDAPAHFGTEGTGVFFVALLKDDIVHSGIVHGIGHLMLFAEFGKFIAIKFAVARSYGKGVQAKIFMAKETVLGQGMYEQYAVLAAGEAYGDFVAVFYELKIFICFAYAAQGCFHVHLKKNQKENARQSAQAFLVLVVGLEPTRVFTHRILNPECLPFHHTSTTKIFYMIFFCLARGIFVLFKNLSN